MASVRIVVLSDASFDNAVNFNSHLVFVIMMPDIMHHANTVHYGSDRCHRVLRSVMAAEVHALVHAVDMGMLIREAMSKEKH